MCDYAETPQDTQATYPEEALFDRAFLHWLPPFISAVQEQMTHLESGARSVPVPPISPGKQQQQQPQQQPLISLPEKVSNALVSQPFSQHSQQPPQPSDWTLEGAVNQIVTLTKYAILSF